MKARQGLALVLACGRADEVANIPTVLIIRKGRPFSTVLSVNR